MDPELLASFDGRLRLERIDPAPPSPARAANRGLQLAEGDLVGLVVDGARLASPGLLAEARRAACLAPRPVITAPAFHLGPVRHMQAAEAGYDQATEDGLLAESGWEDDGYRLFEISTPAGSWGRGLFGPAGESSSLFCPRPIWDELGGLDERFALPGGGLVNHDLYRRACALEGVELDRAARRGDVPPVPRRCRHLAPLLVGRDARRVPGHHRACPTGRPPTRRSTSVRRSAGAASPHRALGPPGDQPNDHPREVAGHGPLPSPP